MPEAARTLSCSIALRAGTVMTINSRRLSLSGGILSKRGRLERLGRLTLPNSIPPKAAPLRAA